MKKARVYSIILIPQLGQYIVTLEEIGGIRLIPIWIGPSEGMAISAKLNSQVFQRPMTHDLISDMLGKVKAKIKKVTITDVKDNTFYASMTLSFNKKIIEIDSRPSDAIALAVRVNAAIFIDDAVFKKCPSIQKPITEQEITDFKKHLENLKPEDFFKKV
ncbi:MAG: bifunctional nuclease family protein [Candidatus Omnitrophica bacterium]|nr:bifunctional nuclease family protein [Candidatus Omnitrophota bacterium]